MEMQIDHFSHRHPMLLSKDLSKNDRGIRCSACCVPVISGPAYICIDCQVLIHKSCAELPMTITHFKHPQHPLDLIKSSPYHSGWCKCDNCNEYIYGFIYHCRICEFDLDTVCGSFQLVIEDQVHEHIFILLRPTTFVCDVCGGSNEGKPMVCTICQVMVHAECASTPHTIKIKSTINHSHPLTLAYSSPGRNVSICKLCYREISSNVFYNCVSCTDYTTHINCSLSMDWIEYNSIMPGGDKLDKRDPAFKFSLLFDQKIEAFVKQNFLEFSEEGKEKPPEFHHFSHSHILSFNQDDTETKKTCDACAQTISDPHYCCVSCNFFLHKSCAELPTKIQHPLHSHHLYLLAKHPLFDGFFTCACCQALCNGFIYCCDYCDFYLDVTCSSLLDTLKHDSHPHKVNYVNNKLQVKCNACGKYCRRGKYKCLDCNFNLHTECALLPPIAWHRWDKHPLKLTFGSVENDLEQYYCDICEGQRGKDLWFYTCFEQGCDMSAHPYCILNEFRGVKLGKTYNHRFHPQHPLTLVNKDAKPCASCHFPCEVWTLECAKCDFNRHVNGFCPDEYGAKLHMSLKQPGPRYSPMQCYVTKDARTLTYFLYTDMPHSKDRNSSFSLAAHLRYKNGNDSFPCYVISLQTNSWSRDSNAYVGKLVKNAFDGEWILYDSEPPCGSVVSPLNHNNHLNQMMSLRRRVDDYNSGIITCNDQCYGISIHPSSLVDEDNASSPRYLPDSGYKQVSLAPVLEGNDVVTNFGSTSLLRTSPLILEDSREPLILKGQVTETTNSPDENSSTRYHLVCAQNSSDKVTTEERGKVFLESKQRASGDSYSLEYCYPLSAFQAFAIFVGIHHQEVGRRRRFLPNHPALPFVENKDEFFESFIKNEEIEGAWNFLFSS